MTENWHTRVSLAEVELIMVVLLHKNKRKIPKDFLSSKSTGSIFGFKNAVLWYQNVPKMNKAVVPLCSMHTDNKIDPEGVHFKKEHFFYKQMLK
jgi:hypothetical protein